MQKVHNESDNDRMTRLTEIIQSSLESERQEKVSIVFQPTEEKKPQKKAVIVCELCDKVFPNRVQKYNHKFLVHTVRDEDLSCDYCDETYKGLKELCKHISSKHGHLFSKRHDQGNQCYICKMKFTNKEDSSKHMDESHSPDIFL